MQKEKYLQLSIEALADDPAFRQWALGKAANTKEWEALAKEYPEWQAKAEIAKQLVVQLVNYYQQELPDRAAPDPKFAAKLKNIVRLDQVQQPVSINRKKVSRRWAIAAAIVILIGASTWLFLDNSPSTVPLVAHTTDFGEWKKVTLPDGSLVHLNANSTLKLPENWEKGSDRKVWLEGEAFFEVEKKPQTNAKFQVVTNALTVEVLGTMFNVKSKGTNTKVFLEEGKIQLKTAKENVELKPNDFIDFDKGDAKVNIQKQAMTQKTDWKEGTLLKPQKTVKEILDRIEEIYGYSYQISDQTLLNQVKTLAVPMDQIEVVLPILEKTLGVSITLENNQLIINK